MEKILQKMSKLGFTELEARTYIQLVQSGEQNGSQVAKALGLSRSSVYSALDQLARKSLILEGAGETRTFQARDPQGVFQRLGEEIQGAALELSQELSLLHQPVDLGKFTNISGRSQVYQLLDEIFDRSQKEIYLNTSNDFFNYPESLSRAATRGVKIWIFSRDQLPEPQFPVTLYHRDKDYGCNTTRIMAVVDMQYGLLANGQRQGELAGTYSRNKLFVSVLAEHIHHDIYLYRLREKLGKDVVTPDILAGSLFERESQARGGCDEL